MSETEQNIFKFTAEITKIGNRAVHKAQEENRKQGIPSVYAKKGNIYYQFPNGMISSQKDETAVYQVNEPKEEGN
ncbi:hypothetical protein [Gracilimonas halophila]|uniref:Uncharacterized protein n=1 Tax=Gracilimonas halophila TaxID=1834464 RepID=A0ABW5JH29_9BACT